MHSTANPNDAVYVRFGAPVNQFSIEHLFKVIDKHHREGAREIHLLISSPGGSVMHGIAMYNYLVGLRPHVEVVTHNFGTVDSIGVILFCAGKVRKSVPNARFLLHPIMQLINQPTKIDDHWLLETKNSLDIDQKNISRIIAAATQKEESEILEKIQKRVTLNPDEAEALGLVTGIEQELIPNGAEIVPIYESAASTPQMMQVPTMQMQIAHPEPVSPPIPNGSTNLYAERFSIAE